MHANKKMSEKGGTPSEAHSPKCYSTSSWHSSGPSNSFF